MKKSNVKREKSHKECGSKSCIFCSNRAIGRRKRINGIVLFMMTLLLIGGWKWDAISAAGLEQTTEEPSVELKHVHTGEEGACFEEVHIPCDGWVYPSYIDDAGRQVYVCVECPRFYYEDDVPNTCEGSWETQMTCELSALGRFAIRKSGEGENAALEARIEDKNAAITDYSIRWNASGAEKISDGSRMPLKANRTYTATLRWYDGKAGTWQEETLSYTELSVPIAIRYLDGETLLQEKKIAYGADLPGISVPEKTGYTFRGFFRGETMYYDAEGAAVYGDTEFSDTTLNLQARWEAKTYCLWYGSDEDGDGLPDESIVVTYGEDIPELTARQSEERKGYHFEGSTYKGQRLIDADGHSTRKWEWDPEGNVVLDTVWEADAYTVYYGEDADEDGMPDQSFEVRYGEVYNAVNVPGLSEYEEFCGYRLGDDLVFDENGKPVGTWKWTVEQPVLKMDVKEIPLPEPEEESVSENELTEAEEAVETEEENTEPEDETVVSENRVEPVTEDEVSPGAEEETEAEEVEAVEELEEEETETEEEGANDAPDDGQEEPGSEESEDTAETVSAAAKEETTPAPTLPPEPTPEPTPTPAPTPELPVLVEEPVFDSEPDDAAVADAEETASETFRLPEIQDNTDAFRRSADPTQQEEVSPGATEESEIVQEIPAVRALPTTQPVGQLTEEVVPDLLVMPEIEEKPRHRSAAAVVGTAMAVTGGCLGGIAGIYAGLVYLFAMAEVFTICTDGRKKRLGKLHIRTEAGRAFSVTLGREILEQCETDRICIRLSRAFVRGNRNRDLIIKMREKSRSCYITREIYADLIE